jgi:hypothetical protein
VKSVFKKIRLPRKVMFVIAGILLLSGASGAYAVYSGKETFLGMAGPEKPSLSGLACTTIETLGSIVSAPHCALPGCLPKKKKLICIRSWFSMRLDHRTVPTAAALPSVPRFCLRPIRPSCRE